MIENLTIVIIAKNEANMLPDCLKSIGDFAGVLLIDTNSTDQTVSIAKKFGAKIVSYNSGKKLFRLA